MFPGDANQAVHSSVSHQKRQSSGRLRASVDSVSSQLADSSDTAATATAPTNLSSSAAGQRPGGCVATAEQHKRDKYEEPCKQRGMAFVPFAVESYGGLGPAARKLLTTLAGLSGERTARAFLLDAMARVSVTLQQIGRASCRERV